MKKNKLIILLLFVLNNFLVFGQCEYNLDNYSHNDCFGDKEIDQEINSPIKRRKKKKKTKSKKYTPNKLKKTVKHF